MNGKSEVISVTTNREHIHTILSQLKETKEKIQRDERAYYDEDKNKVAIAQYYNAIHFKKHEDSLLSSLQKLLRETHTNPVRYDPSEYVYPWVDLRPDGNLKSIYSGQEKKPEAAIQEDYETSLKRKLEMEKTTDTTNQNRVARIVSNFKYNCEHAVPQSWFNEQEPMRGDLHHLFTCEPTCNSLRSNYPYYDFKDYRPEGIRNNRIEEACGKADDGLFEPEYAKGTAARAMLYFLVRYPHQIDPSHKKKIDLGLLIDWHQKFPPDVYEHHRNQAIYNIQGNRNPFIDFPEEMKAVMTHSYE
ncbi:Endonuclease I [Halobacillus karajensis]|uniref:endonuclease I family protein n=1 Tax=Halobacillus karajensis TaxID=195088 RepID=UPI0008A7E88F|nr:endonuclease [Halobacillus karajensis]SEH83496.1 Endonuclease I [Halobacillus karajensis]